MRRLLPLVSACLALALPARSAIPAEARSANPADPIQLKVKLISPRDITVDWTHADPKAAGHIVEWGTRPDDEFVPLGFFPPSQRSYLHPDLLWETQCYYRVRAYYGPASAEVEVTLPKELTDEEYKRRFDSSEDYSWAGPVTVPDKLPVRKSPIRHPETAAAGAPADFKVTLMPVTVSAFKLTWTDRASDEEGTMIELKREGDKEFQVVALVEPNVNSFGYAFEPPYRKGVLRVRPYYYGPPSELLHLVTGKEPEEKAEEKPAAPAKSS